MQDKLVAQHTKKILKILGNVQIFHTRSSGKNYSDDGIKNKDVSLTIFGCPSAMLHSYT
jgi:hypothetical protein